MENLQSRQHYIAGRWQEGAGDIFYSYNPANGAIVWEGCHATEPEVKRAVEAASAALPSWSALSLDERFQYLLRFAKRVEANRLELARLIAKETGKPLWESQTEVTAVVNKVNLSFQAYQERNAEKITPQAETNACLRYKPQGILAVLGAFNFPAHLSNGHIVPALLAGNTVVFKPSELAPAVSQWILECWHAIGLPAGVLNGIQGGGKIGSMLLSMPIHGVCFTGSYQTGKKIHQQLSDRPDIILALEMGGNNPLIIDEVENKEAALYGAVLSTIISAGQRCTCARRIFLPQNSWGDRFLTDFLETLQATKIGAFEENPEPFIGPIIGEAQAKAYLGKQALLIAQGGKPLLTMHHLMQGTGFLTPGLIDMTTVENTLDEEFFAPLIQVYRYKTFEDALTKANDTRYGLVAGLFSDSQSRYTHFYHAMRAGLINWNRPTTGASSSLPFGGVGLSGNNRPSGYFAADYCVYPIASLEQPFLTKPSDRLPGIHLSNMKHPN